MKKDKSITIRINSTTLRKFKKISKFYNKKYQSLLSEIILEFVKSHDKINTKSDLID